MSNEVSDYISFLPCTHMLFLKQAFITQWVMGSLFPCVITDTSPYALNIPRRDIMCLHVLLECNFYLNKVLQVKKTWFFVLSESFWRKTGRSGETDSKHNGEETPAEKVCESMKVITSLAVSQKKQVGISTVVLRRAQCQIVTIWQNRQQSAMSTAV